MCRLEYWEECYFCGTYLSPGYSCEACCWYFCEEHRGSQAHECTPNEEEEC